MTNEGDSVMKEAREYDMRRLLRSQGNSAFLASLARPRGQIGAKKLEGKGANPDH